MTEIKVGILLPRSSLYPMLGADLVNGIKAGLKQTGNVSIRLIYENIGFGGLEDEVYSKAEKLLLQEEVSMVIGYLDHTAAAKLDKLFEGHNKLLLVLDPGAHVPLEWAPSPHRFTISLQAALCSRLTGYLAAREGIARAAFATSFYEAGYLHCFSYQRGFEAGGGATQYHFVIPFRLEQFTIDPLKQAIEQIQPQAVLAQYSAEAGGLFLDGFAREGLHRQTKVYASPFMLEEQWLSSVPFPFEGICGTVSWTRRLSSAMNNIFLERMENEFGKEGNIFSMLGWEAAHFATQAVEILAEHKGNVLKAGDRFRNISFQSPRGSLNVDPATHYMFSPVYKVSIEKDENTGKCCLGAAEEVFYPEHGLEEFVSDGPQGIFSKWTNTYLCI